MQQRISRKSGETPIESNLYTKQGFLMFSEIPVFVARHIREKSAYNMCEPMEKTMDRFSDDCVGNWCVFGFAAAGVHVSGGCPVHLRRRLSTL